MPEPDETLDRRVQEHARWAIDKVGEMVAAHERADLAGICQVIIEAEHHPYGDQRDLLALFLAHEVQHVLHSCTDGDHEPRDPNLVVQKATPEESAKAMTAAFAFLTQALKGELLNDFQRDLFNLPQANGGGDVLLLSLTHIATALSLGQRQLAATAKEAGLT